MKGKKVELMTTQALYAMNRKWITIILAMLIVSVGSVTLAAAGDGNVSGNHPYTSNMTALAGVILSNKTPQAVITKTGTDYPVSASVVIFDEQNVRLRLDQLRLPCQAEITYRLVEGQRHALKIRVTAVDKDASDAFMPEKQLE
jgi:hypothetical protein